MPAIFPVTIPLDEPTDAFPLLLLHVPPGGAPIQAIVKPMHTLEGPVIVGLGLTVTIAVTMQPVLSV